jgi:phenylalanyl-tRNA synthetase alpha subunit
MLGKQRKNSSNNAQPKGDLKVTRQEMNAIAQCMKEKEFRDLFGQYMEEISDPKNKDVLFAPISHPTRSMTSI